MTILTKLSRAVLAAGALSLYAVGTAGAQGFISPFVGYDYGGDSACPTVRDCDDKSLNLGVSFGAMSTLIGFEEEFGYAREFFDDPTVTSSSVLTLMSNVIIGPRIKFFRPYGAGGLGLMKARVELEPGSLLSVDNNDLGWNVGGGVMFLAGHVGIRGDVRFFHGFNDLEVLGLPLSDLKLDYNRVTVGLVFSY